MTRPVPYTGGRLRLALVAAFAGLSAVAAQCLVKTFAGGGASGTESGAVDGTGTAALFSNPYGIAAGADGTLFVADQVNGKIRRVSSSGVVTTLAGGGASGAESGAIDGTGTAALLFYPFGVAVDYSNSTLFVADAYNHCLHWASLLTRVAHFLWLTRIITKLGVSPPAAL